VSTYEINRFEHWDNAVLVGLRNDISKLVTHNDLMEQFIKRRKQSAKKLNITKKGYQLYSVQGDINDAPHKVQFIDNEISCTCRDYQIQKAI
jgi:hypothetical protein